MLDVLFYHGIVITMAGERVGEGIIEDGAVGIQGNRIVAVGKSDVVCAQYQAHRMIDVEGNVIPMLESAADGDHRRGKSHWIGGPDRFLGKRKVGRSHCH